MRRLNEPTIMVRRPIHIPNYFVGSKFSNRPFDVSKTLIDFSKIYVCSDVEPKKNKSTVFSYDLSRSAGPSLRFFENDSRKIRVYKTDSSDKRNFIANVSPLL